MCGRMHSIGMARNTLEPLGWVKTSIRWAKVKDYGSDILGKQQRGVISRETEIPVQTQYMDQ